MGRLFHYVVLSVVIDVNLYQPLVCCWACVGVTYGDIVAISSVVFMIISFADVVDCGSMLKCVNVDLGLGFYVNLFFGWMFEVHTYHWGWPRECIWGCGGYIRNFNCWRCCRYKVRYKCDQVSWSECEIKHLALLDAMRRRFLYFSVY